MLKMKPFQRAIIPAVLIFIALASAQLACGYRMYAAAPPPTGANPGAEGILPTEGAVVVKPPAIPEARMLSLEFPSQIRAGDADVVRLTLEVDDSGNLTPTVSTPGNVTKGEVIVIPNLYETHNVMAEARLDLAGVDIRPGETVSEALLPRQKITFYWSVRPEEVGTYKGTVWFYLHFVPKAGGPESRQALSAQPIEIEATSFLGMKGDLARWTGLAGTLISSVLGFPFLETMLKWIWKRLRG
ncbi:MAG TPA: hypothetical protein VGK00_13500 [Anaerolineales bacterium]|jgi:hypothetical protein